MPAFKNKVVLHQRRVTAAAMPATAASAAAAVLGMMMQVEKAVLMLHGIFG